MDILFEPPYFELKKTTYEKCKNEDWKLQIISHMENNPISTWSRENIDDLLHIYQFGNLYNNKDQKSKVEYLLNELIERYNEE